MNIKDLTTKRKSGIFLNNEEIKYIVDNYVNGTITDDEMADFLLIVYDMGMTIDETYYLTDAMIKSGDSFDLSVVNKKVVDKHSTGGIGDKLTLITSPIVAALGIGVSKMSGRSLGYTGGTADKLESIFGYKINLTKEEFINQLNTVGVAVISQSENIAVADKKIYALRDERKLMNSIPLIVSSIMSKKIASGAHNIVIDLKVGIGAFIKNKKDAINLAQFMIEIGRRYGRRIICLLSDMNYPIGYDIGNTLEVKETIEFLNGTRRDSRLLELALSLSACMIMVSSDMSYENAKRAAEEVLNNGKAMDKFKEWISAQGGDITKLKDYSNKMAIKSLRDGYINNIDALEIGKLVSELGAGRKHKEDYIDYAVGFEIVTPINSKVKRGDILGTIFYNTTIDDMQNRFRKAFTIEDNYNRVDDIVIEILG